MAFSAADSPGLLRAALPGYGHGMAQTGVKEAATEQVTEAATDRVAGQAIATPRAAGRTHRRDRGSRRHLQAAAQLAGTSAPVPTPLSELA
jgi:hypothetical protein